MKNLSIVLAALLGFAAFSANADVENAVRLQTKYKSFAKTANPEYGSPSAVDGKLFFEGGFVEDQADGTHIFYWENGKIREKGITIPVIALTAFDKQEVTEEAISAGMNDIMVKPFEPSKLFQVISNNVKNRESVD